MIDIFTIIWHDFETDDFNTYSFYKLKDALSYIDTTVTKDFGLKYVDKLKKFYTNAETPVYIGLDDKFLIILQPADLI